MLFFVYSYIYLHNNQKKYYKLDNIYLLLVYMDILMQKCHSIIVTDKVQDIGFRSVVEHIGRKLDKVNLLLKSGFDNVNTGLTDIKIGLNNLDHDDV
jgi:hypothetical protein